MGLDSNGIWIFDESEDVAPFSTFMNKLADSVSDAVGPHVRDTGWVTCTLVDGYTGPLRARRIGSRVNLQGVVTPTTNWGAAQANNTPVAASGVPLGSRPSDNLVFYCAGAAITTAAEFRVAITSTGSISVRCGAATHTSGVYINVDYLVD